MSAPAELSLELMGAMRARIPESVNLQSKLTRPVPDVARGLATAARAAVTAQTREQRQRAMSVLRDAVQTYDRETSKGVGHFEREGPWQ